MFVIFNRRSIRIGFGDAKSALRLIPILFAGRWPFGKLSSSVAEYRFLAVSAAMMFGSRTYARTCGHVSSDHAIPGNNAGYDLPLDDGRLERLQEACLREP